MRSITPRRQTGPSVRWRETIFQAAARRIRQASTYRILDNLDHKASHMGATASSMIMMARLACRTIRAETRSTRSRRVHRLTPRLLPCSRRHP
jgi:hypothetical protein